MTTTTTTTTTTTVAPTVAAAPTTEASAQFDAGNEVPAEEAAAVAATNPPSDEAEQPDNSVLGVAATEQPQGPQAGALPTDLPGAASARGRGKFLDNPHAPGLAGNNQGIGWGWPANIKLEIPVPRRVSGASVQ